MERARLASNRGDADCLKYGSDMEFGGWYDSYDAMCPGGTTAEAVAPSGCGVLRSVSGDI
jgi:hypothetical protein